MKRAKGLNDKQLRFCREYAKSLNATQSYIKAGYQVSERVAAANASKLLTNPNVVEYLEEILDVNEVKVVNEITKIAFATLEDFVDTTQTRLTLKPVNQWEKRAFSAIKKITITEHKDGTTKTQIEFYDKLNALEKWLKILRIYPEEMTTMQALRVLGNDQLLLDGQAEGIVSELESMQERIKERLQSLREEE